jgi:hypothetical protein
MARVSNDELAALIIQFKPLIQGFGASIKAWAEGVAGGGPNNDGRYPLQTDFGVTVLSKCPAQMAADALQTRTLNVKMTTGSSFALDLAAHASAFITLEGPAPSSAITVNLPPKAPQGWTTTIMQNGTGKMTFGLNGGNGFYNRQGYTRTAGQGAPMTALCKSVTSQGLSNWWYFGDMSN